MNTWIKFKNWIVNHLPTRRRIIQLYTFLLYNANSKGYIQGKIFQGNTKYMCVPGMNCYSCPGAIGACPLGALQNALASSGTTTAYYMFGIIALYGLIFARTICGFLCPIGLGQELLYKIRTPKLKKNKVTRILSYLKYGILVVLVIGLPVMYAFLSTPMPGFCKYICPAGTFEGGLGLLLNRNNWPTGGLLDMLGPIFTWKFCVLVVIMVASVFVYRAFCRFLCPLGAIYGFFNRISLLGVKLDKNKCTDCGLCVAHCKMDVKHVGDHECINCGECISVCPAKAISWKGSKIFVRPNDIDTPVVTEEMPLSSIMKQRNVSLAAEGAGSGVTMGAHIAKSVPAQSADTVQNNAEQNVIEQNAATVQNAEQQHIASETAIIEESTASKAERPEATATRGRKGRNFWIEVTAWALAFVVLLGALIYFNVIAVPPTEQVNYGVEKGNKLVQFESSLYGGDQAFKLSDNLGEEATILVLFDESETSSTHIDTTLSAFEKFKTDFPDLAAKTKIYALHSSSIADASAYISEHGWAQSGIAFIKDSSNGLFASLGNNASTPTTFILNKDGIITSRTDGQCDEKKLLSIVRDPFCKNEVGALLHDFTVKLYGENDKGKYALLDQTFSPLDYKGDVLVINFWATWCTPCVGELPFFNRIATEYLDKNVRVIAIHGSSTDDVPRYISNKDDWLTYKLIFAQDNIEGQSCLTYELLGGSATWPMTLIVDKTGKITFIRQGSITYEALKSQIDIALAAGN